MFDAVALSDIGSPTDALPLTMPGSNAAVLPSAEVGMTVEALEVLPGSRAELTPPAAPLVTSLLRRRSRSARDVPAPEVRSPPIAARLARLSPPKVNVLLI